MTMSGQLSLPLLGLLTMTSLTLVVARDNSRGRLEFCQNEMLKAGCERDEVVVMTRALYGRMRVSRCVDKDYGYVGCERSVIAQSDAFCSGRRQCEIDIPNPVFDLLKPCPNDLKSYFEAEYQCVKVETGRGQPCRANVPITLTSLSGYIASAQTEEGGRGSPRCPWRITAPSGQRINITLHDFALLPHESSMCQAYAIIRERERSVTVCAGTERTRHIYTSVSNTLEIRIMTGIVSGKDKYFLLKYEVLGCPDPEKPRNGWMERKGSTAEIGCDSSDYKWTLTCTGTVWSGANVNNCSDPATGSVFGRMSWDTSQLPFGASLFVIFAIALALGILILVAGLVIIRCRRRPRPPLPREEHVYQSTKLPPGTINRQLPPVMAGDNDSLYQSSENEYSYIADLPAPVQVSPGKTPGYPSRTADIYSSRKCQDYGTTRQKQAPAPPLPPPVGDYHPRGVKAQQHPRYVERGESHGSDLPTYFVLDHEQQSTSVDAAPMPLRPNHNNNTTSGCLNPARAGKSSIGVKPPDCDGLAKRANQSIHEFTTNYDHVDPNSNHKSV